MNPEQQIAMPQRPPMVQPMNPQIQRPVGPSPVQPINPQIQRPQGPAPIHPIAQGQQMINQIPRTPFTGSSMHLMQHAIPIYHQLNALKKALGTPSINQPPGGMQGF